MGGVKVHPLPVEDRIAGLEDVAVGAACSGDPNKLTGAIVAAESRPGRRGRRPPTSRTIRSRIKVAVADLPRAWHPRSITFVDAIETRGGKTVRGMEAR